MGKHRSYIYREWNDKLDAPLHRQASSKSAAGSAADTPFPPQAFEPPNDLPRFSHDHQRLKPYLVNRPYPASSTEQDYAKGLSLSRPLAGLPGIPLGSHLYPTSAANPACFELFSTAPIHGLGVARTKDNTLFWGPESSALSAAFATPPGPAVTSGQHKYSGQKAGHYLLSPVSDNRAPPSGYTGPDNVGDMMRLASRIPFVRHDNSFDAVHPAPDDVFDSMASLSQALPTVDRSSCAPPWSARAQSSYINSPDPEYGPSHEAAIIANARRAMSSGYPAHIRPPTPPGVASSYDDMAPANMPTVSIYSPPSLSHGVSGTPYHPSGSSRYSGGASYPPAASFGHGSSSASKLTASLTNVLGDPYASNSGASYGRGPYAAEASTSSRVWGTSAAPSDMSTPEPYTGYYDGQPGRRD